MQDFDAPAPGQLAATARYQTHVTIVDAPKGAAPFQPVKVWADTAILTLVEIDGVPTYINATTPAAVQTDASGIADHRQRRRRSLHHGAQAVGRLHEPL